MEGPASTLCLRTRYIKHCKPLGVSANPAQLGPSPLCRGCSRRMVKAERSNSVSKGALPIIPEYPGFQDVKLSRHYLGNSAFNQIFQDLERGKNSSPHLNNFPRRASLVQCLGSSRGHQSSNAGFQDKPLQEYFNERLMELGSYDSKRSSRRSEVFAEKRQSAFLTRRSSCGAVLLMDHQGQEPCSPASQHRETGSQGKEPKETRNILKISTGDFLDLLTMHITAPLEAFVQKK